MDNKLLSGDVADAGGTAGSCQHSTAAGGHEGEC